MKPSLFFLPLSLVLLSNTFVVSVAEEKQANSLSQLVNREVTRYAEGGEFVGAVTLVARDGKIQDLQAHGVRNLKTSEPVTTDSIFKIHSFTKAITCTAALMLYEQDKFQFDDPVSKWLPEFGTLTVEKEGGGEPVKAEEEMLVKHLFTHTSGLSYKHAGLFSDASSLADVVTALATKPLSFEPGTSWEYGMSIDVLGRLVEIWSEQDFATFLDKEILEPLQMVDTAFYVPQEKEGRRVTIYTSGKDKPTEFSAAPENSKVPRAVPAFCMPGGGLYSTATDYFKFLRMIQNGGEWDGKRYLKPGTRDLMVTNQVPESIGWIRFGKQIRDGFGYGYGFNTVVKKSEWDPAAKVGEAGWGGKASCHYWFEPEAGTIVITLEQIIPYRQSLEPVLKGPVYRALGDSVSAK